MLDAPAQKGLILYGRKSPGGVKNPTLSQQQLGKLLWLGVDPWLGNFYMPWAWQKKKKKKKRKKEKEKALDLQANIPHLSPYLLAE